MMAEETVMTHPKIDDFLEVLSEMNPWALKADGFEAAIVGYVERIGSDPLIVFSRSKCIEILISEGMTHEDAVEHFEFNVLGSWVGEGTPFFLTTIDGTV
jgi:hypothetical protein